MDVCYPETTDWSCRWTAEELADQRADPLVGPQIERSEAFAWSLLAALCAYRIGTCPVTVRPCSLGCGSPSSFRTALVAPVIGWLNPYKRDGVWVNGCGCRSNCSCTALSEVLLPGPVGSVVSVSVDGEVLPRSAYRVDNGGRLVRLDGGTWPVCQDMTASDEDGFAVTYYVGSRPNRLTNAAAGALANEFLLSCEGKECRLPGNVTSMSRSGESYEFAPTDFSNGQTDIPEVNAVIRIYNPYSLKMDAVVASPDSYETRVPTWR